MANWVFKLKGLASAQPAPVKEFGLGDNAVVRALAYHRQTKVVDGVLTPETDAEVWERLITAFFAEKVIAADYVVRKTNAQTAAIAGITHAVPTVNTTET